MQTFHSVFTLKSLELLNALLSRLLLPSFSSYIRISAVCLSCLLFPPFFESTTFSFASNMEYYDLVVSVGHSSFFYHVLQLPAIHF